MMHQLRFVQNIKMGIKNLMMHKLRSFLTVLGIVFGVGSVIAMLSVGEGASKEALEQIRKLGSNNIILTSVKPIEEKVTTTRPMLVYGLLYEDELRIRESIPAVLRTVPVKLIRKNAYLGERLLQLRIVGTTPDWFDLVKRQVIAGRVLSWEDFDKHAQVCVLTEYSARRLLATEHTIGQPVRIGSHYFNIIGIVQSEQGRGDAQTPDQVIDAYLPLNTARERYGDAIWGRTSGSGTRERVELHQLLVQVESIEQVEPTATAIRAIIQLFHKKNDFRISVPLRLLRQAEATKRTFNIVLGSIAAISLLVSGIGIMNIMLASGTYPRDRHTAGGWREAQTDHWAVPHRDRCAFHRRRPDGHWDRDLPPLADYILQWFADHRTRLRHRSFPGDQHWRRRAFRSLPSNPCCAV
jgi:putative ABC transport system permease protein